MSKTVRLSSKGQVVIPKTYRDALGLTEGSELVMMVRDASIVLVSARDFAKLSLGAAKGTWGGGRKGIDRLIELDRKAWD